MAYQIEDFMMARENRSVSDGTRPNIVAWRMLAAICCDTFHVTIIHMLIMLNGASLRLICPRGDKYKDSIFSDLRNTIIACL